MARGGRVGRRRRRGRRGGGSAQGDGSEPSFVARPVPAHDELTPYLRTGLTRAVVASLREYFQNEVLDADGRPRTGIMYAAPGRPGVVRIKVLRWDP